MAGVRVSDVVVPRIFTPYVQQQTEEKTRIIQAGVLAANPLLNNLLAGGGKTFDVPSWRPLDSSDSTGADNVSTDQLADIQSFEAGEDTAHPRNDATPMKIQTSTEVAARMNRNQSWSSTDLARQLAGSDPMQAIANEVSTYWSIRLQRMFVSTWQGIIADNLLAPNGDDTHTQNDLIHNISTLNGGVYLNGVTNFSAEALLDAQQTMGDSQQDLAVLMVHSVVYNRMQKNNLIDFIPDARGEVQVPTFQGLEVITDDGMPRTGQVYDSWIFGLGAAQFGESEAPIPTETSREALAGNGGGQDTLTTRRQYIIHPTGHAFIQTGIPDGGPTNANLQAAANWSRVYPERKMIKFAVLRSREA